MHAAFILVVEDCQLALVGTTTHYVPYNST
jgi:hypothetical protein